MLRKKEILQAVYERCGQKTHAKLVKTNAGDKMVSKELSQVKSSMELNSTRVHPNLSEFAETMEIKNL